MEINNSENGPFNSIEFEKDGFKFCLELVGESLAPWAKRGDTAVFEYNLNIECSGGPAQDFAFFGSMADWEAGKHPRTKADVIEIADMTIRDASTYDNAPNIDEFATELGITKVSEAIQAYEGCKEAHDFWNTCNMPQRIDDYYELSSKWQEEYDF